jgi:hypothetical protein
MSDPRFIFESVDFQNGANTINNYVANYNAVNTSNPFQFRSDYDRMKNLIGSKGQSRSSGYYDGLYASYYAMTVSTPTVASSNGPGGSGWGRLLWTGPLQSINLNDAILQSNTGQSENVIVQIGGYVYSPTSNTISLQTVSDDGVVVFLNGTKVIDNWTYHGPATDTSAVLTVFQGYNPITIRYFEGPGTGVLDFSYRLGSNPFTGLLKCNFFYNYNQM